MASNQTLTVGNSAKLFCLRWIERYVQEDDRRNTHILDIGCGAGLNFKELLKRFPTVHYVGVEPSAKDVLSARENLRGLNATVIRGGGYRLYERLQRKFDLVVSFSVLEHVYKRVEYLLSAKKCLKDKGYFLINYDAGHFVRNRERLKNLLGPVLARFGVERFYQSRVYEDFFHRTVEELGFEIIDAKFFNSELKGVFKVVQDSKRTEYMNRWLELELWLNDIGVDYDDSKAKYFGTRNFILALTGRGDRIS